MDSLAVRKTNKDEKDKSKGKGKGKGSKFLQGKFANKTTPNNKKKCKGKVKEGDKTAKKANSKAKSKKTDKAKKTASEARSSTTEEANNGMDADADLLQGPFHMHRRSTPADKKEPCPVGLVMTYGKEPRQFFLI